MELVREVYKITKLLPRYEQFILVSQIIRCAISIPSNIAEGYARKSNKEYKQFLYVAYGSQAELLTQLLIIKTEYKSVDIEKAIDLCDQVGKMLYVFISKIN